MTQTSKMTARLGFTLVELSIVIVIIGFLVAGIAAGANMVKQAELRSVITDIQSYQTAYNNFLGRYNKVPGDMDTASAFFTAAACAESATAANCDGDGDGLIEVGAAAGADEVRPAVKHLSLANMISAGIPVVPTTLVLLTAGTNTPASKISGAGYFLASGNPNLGGTAVTTVFGASSNVVYLGKLATGDNLVTGSVKAEDAFNIDQKLDDAVVTGGNFQGATTGSVRARDGRGATANDCANGANYTITNTTTNCLAGLALN